MDVEKERQENAIEYYTQRANYLEGGVTITGKAPSKTERKQSSRQLAATRKQLISELKGVSEKKAKRRKKSVEVVEVARKDASLDVPLQTAAIHSSSQTAAIHSSSQTAAVHSSSQTTAVHSSSQTTAVHSSSQLTSDSTSSKTEAQRRVDALLRLSNRSSSDTPAKKPRRKRKEEPPPRLSWEANLKPLLSSSVVDMEPSAFAELLQTAVTRESSFCCALNDGTLSYQVGEKGRLHRRADRRSTKTSRVSWSLSPSSSRWTERSR